MAVARKHPDIIATERIRQAAARAKLCKAEHDAAQADLKDAIRAFDEHVGLIIEPDAPAEA